MAASLKSLLLCHALVITSVSVHIIRAQPLLNGTASLTPTTTKEKPKHKEHTEITVDASDPWASETATSIIDEGGIVVSLPSGIEHFGAGAWNPEETPGTISLAHTPAEEDNRRVRTEITVTASAPWADGGVCDGGPRRLTATDIGMGECDSNGVFVGTPAPEETWQTWIIGQHTEIPVFPWDVWTTETTLNGDDDPAGTTKRIGIQFGVCNPTENDCLDEVQPTATGFDDVFSPSAAQITSEARTSGPAARPRITIGNSVVLTAAPATSMMIGKTTLLPSGDTATLGNGPSKTLIHLGPSGQPVIVVGTTTSTFVPTVSLGNKLATPIPSGLVIENQTLLKEGPPITLESGPTGTTVSFDKAGNTIVVDNSRRSTFKAPPMQTIVIGDITATIASNDAVYTARSSTLALGRPITVDNIAMTLTTDIAGATLLIVHDRITTLVPARTANIFDIATTLELGMTEYVINSKTLAPGHPITVQGVPVSILSASSATVLIVGNQTTTIQGVRRTGTGTDQTITAVNAKVTAPEKAHSASARVTRESGRWNLISLGAIALLGLG